MRLIRYTLIAALLALGFSNALAGGTVGTGTPASCTAAELASKASSGGTVTFNCGPNPHTITLTSEIVLSNDTVIDGGGLITLSGGGSTRILVNQEWKNLTLRNLTLRDAYVENNIGGAAVFSKWRANVTVENVKFINNTARITPSNGNGGGGAIYVHSGTLHVTNSEFTGNRARQGNGAAIYGMLSNIRVTHTSFVDNHSTRASGNPSDVGRSGALYTDGTLEGGTDGYITLRYVRFINNSGYNQGGAALIFLYRDWQPGSSATVEYALFKDNRVLDAGDGSGFGAALRVGNGPLKLRHSLFVNNDADSQGGGLWLGETASANITNVTFTQNDAKLGGAIAFQNSGAVTVNNSTFSGNFASWNGGATFGEGAPITVMNSIFANNQAGNPWNLDHNCGHTYNNGGNNLQFPATSGAPNDHRCVNGITFANPMLGTLTNGGTAYTDVMPPQAGSAAVNNGNNNTCASIDQRGIDRPQGSACEIGAAEISGEPAGAFLILNPAANGTFTGADAQPTFRWTASSNAATYRVQLTNTTSGVIVFNKKFTAQQLGCTNECSFGPSLYSFTLGNRKNYRLRVTAFGLGGNSQQNVLFSTLFPGYATLTEPINNVIINTAQPALRWSHVNGAQSYRVVIKRKSDNKVIFTLGWYATGAVCGGANCALNLAALPGGGSRSLSSIRYTWQVVARNAYGKVNSSPAVFKVE